MSEADNLTNLAFPERLDSVNSTAADQANTYSSDLPDETLAPVILPAAQAKNRQSIDFPAFSSVKPTGKAIAALASFQPTELISLIQELHSSNSNLLNRAKQLEQALAKCQEALQSHKKRSSVAESTLTQQTQELMAAQDQLRSLFHELEASHKTAQRQQILIETLTAQLESSQERVAQLERECSLTQASYNEQSHQLVQTENTCRELRTRLTRQQRHTLQFKVALEKCLEVPVSSYQSQSDSDAFSPVTRPLRDLKNVPDSPPFMSKVQPIPPWSAQTQFFTIEPGSASDSPLSPTPPSVTLLDGGNPTDSPLNGGNPRTQVASATWAEYSSSLLTPQSSILDWSNEYLSAPEEDELLVMLETDEQAGVRGIEKNLTYETQALTPSESSEELDTSELEEEQWQDLVSLLETVEELVTANSAEDLLEGATVIGPSPADTGTQLDEPLNESEPAPRYSLDIGLEQVSPQTNEFQLTKLPQLETSSFTPNTNWPSAVVYPLRPPKGRKSLAEIELPPFS